MGLEQLLTEMKEQHAEQKPDICPVCSTEYRYMGLGHYKCPQCGNETCDDYGKIRDYVESSEEEVGVEKASIETGVSVDRIKELIAMGKVSLGTKKR